MASIDAGQDPLFNLDPIVIGADVWRRTMVTGGFPACADCGAPYVAPGPVTVLHFLQLVHEHKCPAGTTAGGYAQAIAGVPWHQAIPATL